MKCKNCRGTGERHTINWETGKVYIVQGEKCPVCGGKGDIEQTNEEYMQTCSSDELANTIFRLIVHGTVIRPDREYIKKWLKEKHDDLS